MCGKIDNEQHRINSCKKWELINFRNKAERIEFSDIFTGDDRCHRVIEVILMMWDLEHGRNEMQKL